MHDRIRQAARIGLRGTLLRVALALLLPTAAWAGGHTIKVPLPTGVDDTANIQKALDEAVAKGPGTTVQLAPGRYLTQQLATYNFHGTFRGMGKDKTIIEALPHLWIDPSLNFWSSPCPPNGGANRWPSLIIFVDGDIRVADLSIKITAAPGTATTPWRFGDSWCTFLLEALRFMGTTTTSACVDGISIEGLPDSSATSWGWNILNGVDFVGELPRSTADLDYFVLSGDFTVRNSSFKTTGYGVYVGGFIRDSKVTIGGSPTTGNAFEDVVVGLDMEGQENTRFEISHNRSEATWWSMSVIPWIGIVPAKPAYYSIHDNTFLTTGPYADGIYLMDDPAKPWIRARIFNNTIELKNEFMWAGVGAYNTRGTFLWNNTITGSGAAAIQLGGDAAVDSYCTLIGNHIRGFAADPSFGLAQIHLGPATSHNLVVCPSPLDTVLDEGTQNLILGGWPQAKALSGPASLRAIPNPPAIQRNPLNRRLAPRK